jgi:cell wall assembly regulator SMI1
MNDTWIRLERWLEKHDPILLDTLNGPATAAALDQAARHLGVQLPEDLRASLLRHEGQSDTPGLMDWRLFCLDEVVGEWNTYQEDSVGPYAAAMAASVTPHRGIRDVYWSPRWVPVAGLGSSDVVCVDLDPAPGGVAGQVIMRWKSGDREVLAPSFGAWLAGLAGDMEAGRCMVDEEGFLER